MGERPKVENVAKLKNKKVLVTGGAGFIGSYLVDDLVAQKNQVVVIDNLSSGKRENINPRAKFYKVDIRSKEISKIFKKEKPEVVFHIAAYPIVEKALRNPIAAFDTNIMGTVNVLEACRAIRNIKSIIVASSDKAYGKSKKLPYKETSPLQGDHPYDAPKSSADLIAQTYFKTYDLPILITRFSNVFGPRDYNTSRIIPGIMEAVMNKKTLLIRSDGKMVREYTYVKDIVQGCIALATYKKSFGEAFNFGSNNIFSVIEVVKKSQATLGKKVEYKILNNAKNEIPKQYLDWSKAKEKLKWQPKTSFDQGIKETFDWYQRSLES